MGMKRVGVKDSTHREKDNINVKMIELGRGLEYKKGDTCLLYPKT